MADDPEIEEKFWDELKDSPFVMLGIEGARDGAIQPMTANFDEQDCASGCVYFFTANDHDFTRAMGPSSRGIGAFSAKGHGLFASLRGTLSIANDPEVIDRLWNPVVAEWYEGKDDPKLTLLRLDVEDAKVWLSDTAGLLTPVINKLFGRKPEASMDRKVAELSL